MRRLALLTPLLLLAACAGQPLPPVQILVITATPAPIQIDELLPVEAQRLIDRATATAAAMATSQAQATGARLATQQALQDAQEAATLAAAQTQAALDVTLQVAAATGAAGATGAIQTRAVAQTSAWATPTWSAVATGRALAGQAAAATGTQLAEGLARSHAGSEAFRNAVGGISLIAVLGALGLVAVVVYFRTLRENAQLETFRQVEAERVDRERAQTDRTLLQLERERLEMMRALMIERDGRPWLLTPSGRLVPMLPGALEPVAQPNQAREWRWRAELKKVVYCGIELGGAQGPPRFGERDLAGPVAPWVVNVDGTASSAGYRKLNRLLRHMGIWTTAGRDTTWGPEWNAERFEREFDATPLPDLPDGEPPTVRIPHRSFAVAAILPGSAVPRSD